MESEDPEIIRLRARTHALESKIVGLEWIVNDLREWRAETRGVIDKCRKDIDGMLNADSVAEQVAEALRGERLHRWTLTEKTIGVLVAVGTLATAIHGWI